MSKFLPLALLCLTASQPAQEGMRVEVLREGGTAQTGRLRSFGDQYKVEFEKGAEALNQFTALKNPHRSSMLPRGQLIHRIELITGEILHGRLLRLDSDSLGVETRWAETLSVPRQAVRSIAHGSEGQPVLIETFEESLGSNWKIDPRPEYDARAKHSGKRGLRLDLPKESIFSPPMPLASGAIKFWLRLPDMKSPTGGFELHFQAEGRKQSQEVRWGPKGFVASVPFPAEVAAEIPSSPGWHLVQIEWDERKRLLLIDDRVLFSGKPRESAGVLGQIHFRQGDFDIDDLILFEPRATLAPSRLDPNRDELLRRGQDQLVGRVESIDEEGVEFRFRESKRRFPWTEVRSLSFATGKFEPKSLAGQKVRVSLASLDASRDTIEGILRRVSEQSLVIDHAILGTLSIPFDLWRELRPR